MRYAQESNTPPTQEHRVDSVFLIQRNLQSSQYTQSNVVSGNEFDLAFAGSDSKRDFHKILSNSCVWFKALLALRDLYRYAC